MNALVKGAYGQLLNYSHASLKLDHKERKTGKVKRIYGAAQTPLARVLASAEVAEATKERLLKEKARLDPFALKQAVTRSMKAISPPLSATLTSPVRSTNPLASRMPGRTAKPCLGSPPPVAIPPPLPIGRVSAMNSVQNPNVVPEAAVDPGANAASPRAEAQREDRRGECPIQCRSYGA